MSDQSRSTLSRRELLGAVGTAAAAVALQPILRTAIAAEPRRAGKAAVGARLGAGAPPVNGVAGVDRVVVLPGKTYLRGWAGYGEPPHRGEPRRRGAPVDTTP